MANTPTHSRAGAPRAEFHRVLAAALPAGLGVCIALTAGCEVDSWMDPSRTGYFEFTPTSIPILRKIDVIEVEREPFATEIGTPKAEDLVFGSTEYQFGYGDVLEVQINDLFQQDKPEGFRRTVDQAGRILLPVVGQIEVTGRTAQQVMSEITDKLRALIPNPSVDVSVIEARNYTFTVYGDVRNPGIYTLSRPDFDVVQAVALAGGANEATKRVRIVRVVADPDAPESTDAGSHGPPGVPSPQGSKATTKPTPTPAAPDQPTPPPASSIDDLINQLAPSAAPSTPPATPPATPPTAPPATPPTAPPPTADPKPPLEPPPPASNPATPPPATDPVSPGAMRSTAAPAVPLDIEQLEAPTTQDKPVVNAAAGVQTPPRAAPAQESQYVFDVQKQEWVLVTPAEAARTEHDGRQLVEPNSPEGAVTGGLAAQSTAAAVRKPADFRLPTGQKTRILVIDWIRLRGGDLMLNAVIRPGDKIYVEVDAGVVYIDGEIARPGVYSLPAIGDLTLSRLVSAAGGLGQIAVPQRVDLIRKIAPDREAAIRVNLAAIRNRAEPDIELRADDQIIIGTNFLATPLAVIRNGFRMTYGFGFLIDRNFGNDVFGAPPSNVLGQ